jgi:hypothetical protein
MSLIGVALDVGSDEALAVLRAHAHARSRTVDDLAADVVEGRYDPRQFLGDGVAKPG